MKKYLKIFLAISTAALLLTGCLGTPDPELTNSGLEEPMTENANKTEQHNLPGVLLFDFQPGVPPWNSVDDDVMGGVSSSAGRITEDGTLLFSGTMSLENNGGFASLRSPWNPIDLSGKDGLLIRVLGDGQLYRLRIRTSDTGREIAYNSFFETGDGEWGTVYLPFETMVPTLRGFRVPAGELNPASITGLGLMLSDKQPGEFALEVDWIRVVEEGEIGGQ